MENHRVILQDEDKNQHQIIRVKDVTFNTQTLMNTHHWLWVYAESYEFFPFESWERLNHAKVSETISLQGKRFKVIKILKAKKPKFS